MELRPIKEIKPNPDNPRIIRDEKFAKLKTSIQEFPEMLKLRPIVVDENDVILGGNMRYRALQELKHKEVWTIKANELTEAQKREFIIKDNVGFGEWEWDTLANKWDAAELEAWGLDIPGFDSEGELDESDQGGDEFTRLEVECKDPEQLNDLMDELHSRGFNVKAK
jgi:ParB-like chromosome segregation protein Spo0J